MSMDKQLIGGIQKFSTSDGPGIRTTVFTKGCPLHCAWCHNPELISPRQELLYNKNLCIRCGHCQTLCPQNALSWDTERGTVINRQLCDSCLRCAEECYSGALRAAATPRSVEEVMALAIQDRDFYDHTNGGITLSGGEILSHPDFALAMTKRCEQEGIRIVVDTCGFGSYETLLALAEQAQMILYDLKSIDDSVHQTYTGQSNALILENLAKLSAKPEVSSKIQIRMPLVHDVNDTEPIIAQTADFLSAHHLTDVILIPYHELGVAKQRSLGLAETAFSPPSQERLQEIKSFFASKGISAQIIGLSV